MNLWGEKSGGMMMQSEILDGNIKEMAIRWYVFNISRSASETSSLKYDQHVLEDR
jgi:hypothetical protein